MLGVEGRYGVGLNRKQSILAIAAAIAKEAREGRFMDNLVAALLSELA
jgi:urease gamma subunit